MKRILPLLGIIVVTATLGAFAWQVKFDNSIEVWFLENDPDLVSYRDFTSRFDSDQIVVLAWRDPQLWTAEGLDFVHRVGEAVTGVEYVEQVRSICTIVDVVAEPGLLSVRPLA